MSLLRNIASGLRSLFRKEQVDRELGEEVGAYGILRHAKIQTTLDLYMQEDSDETRAAQGEFLTAVGMSTTVN
jgi:hypothetical protein